MKRFIKVIASFDSDGNMTPKLIIWDEKRQFSVDKITDIRYTDSPQNQNAGIRFTCIIHGKQKYLYFEQSRWFVKTA